MPLKDCSVTVSDDNAGRVDRVVQVLTGLSRRQLNGLFEMSSVRVNGHVCLATHERVAAGDVVEVSFDPQRKRYETTENWHSSAFRTVYEDDHVIVVDKSPSVLTVPTGERARGTLVDAVTHYLNRGAAHKRKAYVVHRLDRGVSGLLVFGKSLEVMHRLKDQFADHKPKREYLALAAGVMTQKKGTFRSYLATSLNLDVYSTKDTKKGELAITHFQVVQPLPRLNATLVKLNLETGKRNQIRVHLAEAGHPVLGDMRYETAMAKHPAWQVKRMALHAVSLGFDHPITGKAMHFESALPPAFDRFVRAEAGDEQPQRRKGRRGRKA